MKRYIKSSAGDILLSKFVLIPSDLIPGVAEEYYVDRLGGYLWLWNYTYNKLTHETDDRLYSHSDVIDNLPFEIKKKPERIWGRVDWFKDNKRFFISDSEALTHDQLNYLKQKCGM